MGLICEDLSAYGVVLVPPASPRYFDLLFDIERRLHNRPKGSPPVSDEDLSAIAEHDIRNWAILLNEARVAIVSLAYTWETDRNGCVASRSYLQGTNASIILPFGLDARVKKFDYYWKTVFAGSKRLMFLDGDPLGDNTDIRPPKVDELWSGGFLSSSGGERSLEEPLKLTLDGVFFEDGGFAGPNQLGAWESTVFAAEAYLACSELARKARMAGTAPGEFLLEIKRVTGYKDDFLSTPPHPRWSHSQIRDWEWYKVGRSISRRLRKQLGDEAAMRRIESWADLPAPALHKL